jgi:hypothetical protein
MAVQPDAQWAAHKPDVSHPTDPDGPMEVLLDGDVDSAGDLGLGSSNVIHIQFPDGSMEIVVGGLGEPERKDAKFDENLAAHMDPGILTTICEELMEGIQADERSRADWIDQRTDGLDQLGMKLEKPRTGPGGGTTGAPLQGMSTAKDCTLTEAVIKAQANAIGEFLPADGPAKIEDEGNTDKTEEAILLERDFNEFLTEGMPEFYPDTKRMLAWLYFGGSGFKKVYHCPLRRRPTSESVDAQNLIVSNDATDFQNAARVTHRSMMRRSVFRRMVMGGHYLDLPSRAPPSSPDNNQVDEKVAEIEGINKRTDRNEDNRYEMLECYTELEITDDPMVPKEFIKNQVPVPYRVTIEKDSRTIVDIRRNWKQDDPDCKVRDTFVKYSFIDWMGFYGIGLIHIIGNLQLALTAMLRIAIDNGMFANFPGGLFGKSPLAKQLTNQLNPGPGEFAGIDMQGLDDIRKVVMQLPYHDTTPGLLNLLNGVREYAQRVAGTADLPVGEGRADMPVGTILAVIEQATKVESAVHKGLHHSQSKELQMIADLLREDPEAVWRHKTKKQNQYSSTDWNTEAFLKALNDHDLVPKSDPNTPSHIHRIMKMVSLLTMVAQNPAPFKLTPILTDALRVLGFGNPEKYLKSEAEMSQQGPPSPEQIAAQAKMLDATTKQGKAASDAQLKQQDQQNKTAEMQNDQQLEDKKLAAELVIHSADRQKIAAETGAKVADANLAVRKQAHDENLAEQEHGLNLKAHALDAAMAAHEAAVDTHAAGLAESQQGIDAASAANPEPKGGK